LSKVYPDSDTQHARVFFSPPTGDEEADPVQNALALQSGMLLFLHLAYIFENSVFIEQLSPLAAYTAKNMLPLTQNSWQYEIITTGLAQVFLVMKTVDGKLGFVSRVSPLMMKAQKIDEDYGISKILLENAERYGIAGEGGILDKIAKVRVPMTGDKTVKSLYESAESLCEAILSTTSEKVFGWLLMGRLGNTFRPDQQLQFRCPHSSLLDFSLFEVISFSMWASPNTNLNTI
jgi:hypothetical protein